MNAISPLSTAPLSTAAVPHRAPSAEAAAFVRDEASQAAIVAALGPAAPAALVRLGGVEDAIAHLAHDPSPRTLVVDLSGVAEPFVALDHLAEVCLPGTSLVALGEINDIQFYRRLRAAGVADYLLKPVSGEAVRAALEMLRNAPQAAAAPQPAVAPRRDVVAVIGARGGVGATMVAVSLAWLSAERERRRTVLVDLDLLCGSTGLALDIEAGHGLSEALASPDRIDALLIAGATSRLGEHLFLLSSEQPLDASRPIQPGALERLVAALRQDFQRMILDTPRADCGILAQALEQASTVLVVTDFSLAGARDTGRLIGLAEKLAPSAKRLVIGNRLGSARKGELPRAEIERALGVKLAVVIPEDAAAVPRALNTGKPVPGASPGSKVTVALRSLAEMLGTPPPPRRGVLARLFGGGGPDGPKP